VKGAGELGQGQACRWGGSGQRSLHSVSGTEGLVLRRVGVSWDGDKHTGGPSARRRVWWWLKGAKGQELLRGMRA